MFDFLNITRALSDENRIRILMALSTRDLCVCQVTAFLDLAPSTTSKHLSVLRQARLIESTRHGKWVYYTLAKNSPSPAIQGALQWIATSLGDNSQILDDETRMQQILQAETALGLDDGEQQCHSAEIHSVDLRMAQTDGESVPEEPSPKSFAFKRVLNDRGTSHD